MQIANLNDHLSDPAAINGFNAATKFVVSGASLCCFASWCVLTSPPLVGANTPGTTDHTVACLPAARKVREETFPASHILNSIDAAFAPMGTWPTLKQITVKHFELAVVEQQTCNSERASEWST